MVGNTMPAINDITVAELVSAVEDIAGFCPTIKVCSQQKHTLSSAIMIHSQRKFRHKYRAQTSVGKQQSMCLAQLRSMISLQHLVCQSSRLECHPTEPCDGTATGQYPAGVMPCFALSPSLPVAIQAQSASSAMRVLRWVSLLCLHEWAVGHQQQQKSHAGMSFVTPVFTVRNTQHALCFVPYCLYGSCHSFAGCSCHQTACTLDPPVPSPLPPPCSRVPNALRV